jgi:hypothetical protein
MSLLMLGDVEVRSWQECGLHHVTAHIDVVQGDNEMEVGAHITMPRIGWLDIGWRLRAVADMVQEVETEARRLTAQPVTRGW